MTEKQIIIDGVDVAGCQHYLNKRGLHTKHNGRCLIFDCKCHKIDINTEDQCYYKQLKRTEKLLQEIKEIAEDIINNDVYENSDAKAERILEKIQTVI